jgi:hypothetical protein
MMGALAASGPVLRQCARPLASGSTLTAEYDRHWDIPAILVGPRARENQRSTLYALRIVRPTYILNSFRGLATTAPLKQVQLIYDASRLGPVSVV